MRPKSISQENIPSSFCPKCNKEIQPKLMEKYERIFEGPVGVYDNNKYYALCIVECPREKCKFAFFIVVGADKSQRDGVIWSEETKATYPQPRWKIDDRIPEDVRQDFHEATYAWLFNLKSASALMLRRTLENACNKCGAKKDDLKDKIDELAAQGKLHPINVESAHKTRLIGNFTAHLIKDVSKDELKSVIYLVEKIMEDLFITPIIRDNLDTSRKKK